MGLTVPPATSTFPAAPAEKVRLALAALLPLAAPKKAGLALAAIALAAIPPLAARLAPAAIASWVARKKMGCSKEA